MTKSALLIVIASVIWGGAFVAQKSGGDTLGPFTFCCLRNLIAAAAMIPVISLLARFGLAMPSPLSERARRATVRGGVICGICLGLILMLQQFGLWLGTPAGKAGFLTVLYILLVPIIGAFIGRRSAANVWVAVVIAIVGLYLLCTDSSLSIEAADMFVLACAAANSVHILVVDRYIAEADAARLSCISFAVASVAAIPPMIAFESGVTVESVAAWARGLTDGGAILSLLYTGLLSSGVAYTLVNFGQRNVPPATASLLMSLESVFAAIAGALLLGERLTPRELAGCAVIFAAITLAQMKFHPKKGLT